MEQIDIPQERRYCSKLGFSVLAIMLWSILWQFGLYWLDGWILPFRMPETDRKSTRLNSSHVSESRMPSSA